MHVILVDSMTQAEMLEKRRKWSTPLADPTEERIHAINASFQLELIPSCSLGPTKSLVDVAMQKKDPDRPQASLAFSRYFGKRGSLFALAVVVPSERASLAPFAFRFIRLLPSFFSRLLSSRALCRLSSLVSSVCLPR